MFMLGYNYETVISNVMRNLLNYFKAISRQARYDKG